MQCRAGDTVELCSSLSVLEIRAQAGSAASLTASSIRPNHGACVATSLPLVYLFRAEELVAMAI